MNPRLRYRVGSAVLGILTAAVVTAPPPASAQMGHHAVVLGSSQYGTSSAYGWGTAHPARIFNGGDPSGLAKHLRWHRWGHPRATAYGKAYAAKPGGGYYARMVPIVLRASAVGRCDGKRAYRRLYYRMAPKPGAPLQMHWHAWGGRLGDICRS